VPIAPARQARVDPEENPDVVDLDTCSSNSGEKSKKVGTGQLNMASYTTILLHVYTLFSAIKLSKAEGFSEILVVESQLICISLVI